VAAADDLTALSDDELEELARQGEDLLAELDGELERRTQLQQGLQRQALSHGRKGAWCGLRATGWALAGTVCGTLVAPWLGIPFAVLTAYDSSLAVFHAWKASTEIDITRLLLPGQAGPLLLPGGTDALTSMFPEMTDEALRESRRKMERMLRDEIPREWRRRLRK
jgi:hypothetical protein